MATSPKNTNCESNNPNQSENIDNKIPISVQINYKNIKTGETGTAPVCTSGYNLHTKKGLITWIFDIRDMIAVTYDWEKNDTIAWYDNN